METLPLVPLLLLWAIAAHLVGYTLAAWWLFWIALWVTVALVVFIIIAFVTKLVSG